MQRSDVRSIYSGSKLVKFNSLHAHSSKKEKTIYEEGKRFWKPKWQDL